LTWFVASMMRWAVGWLWMHRSNDEERWLARSIEERFLDCVARLVRGANEKRK
jgi:hypothetical protein